DLVRRVVGVSGAVSFTTELRLHFDYARALPWVRQVGTPEQPALSAIAGPEAVIVRGIALTAADHAHTGEIEVAAGQTQDLVLSWHASHETEPPPLDTEDAVARTRAWWQGWASPIEHHGPHHD